MLDGVEVAPLDRPADRTARRGVELGEVGRHLRILAEDRHRQDIGLDGRRRAGGRAHAHAECAPSWGWKEAKV